MFSTPSTPGLAPTALAGRRGRWITGYTLGFGLSVGLLLFIRWLGLTLCAPLPSPAADLFGGVIIVTARAKRAA